VKIHCAIFTINYLFSSYLRVLNAGLMIPFFRRIRQQLLKDNRATKYLLYATGEIILLVIGILVALYFNNLNESQKTEEKVDLIYTASYKHWP
jgi:hypothetical protein